MSDLDAARREIMTAVGERDPESAAAVERSRRVMLAFCDEHPDALWRTCSAGHLTGSALVMERTSKRILLLHHRKLRRWLQPGGHADGEGDLGLVALREACEETGLTGLRLVRPAIDLDVHEIPARGTEAAHVHLDVRYLVLAERAEPRMHELINHEAIAARWLDPDVEADLIEGDLSRLVRAGLARREPLV